VLRANTASVLVFIQVLPGSRLILIIIIIIIIIFFRKVAESQLIWLSRIILLKNKTFFTMIYFIHKTRI